MIRTVAVYAGESTHARVAQHHAVEIAKRFSARLRVLGLWTTHEDEQESIGGGEAAQELLKRSRRDVLRAAARAGVEVFDGPCGIGRPRGVDEEARETDLLVIGIPRGEPRRLRRGEALPLNGTVSLMRKADCDILVVNGPPRPIHHVLVLYEGGNAGKAVLRLSGAVAERYSAKVSVLTMQNALAEANRLAAAAVQYLKAFSLPSVEALSKIEPNPSKEVIVETSSAIGADMIAMTDKVRNALERFLSANIAERTALSSNLPLLIAR